MIDPGRRATEKLLERAQPDAIFCANDLLAIGALAALREGGLDVPSAVAVVGMDATDLSALVWPPLSSVDLGSARRARAAAELLFKRIERPRGKPKTVRVEPRLVVRASSGAAA